MNFRILIMMPAFQSEPKLGLVLPLALILVSGFAEAAHELEGKLPESVSTQQPTEDIRQKITIPEYVTPLQSFQKYVESGEPNWKAANELVGEIGGWRAYAREAYLADRQEREATKKAMEQKKAAEQNETARQAEKGSSQAATGKPKKDDMKTPAGDSE